MFFFSFFCDSQSSQKNTPIWSNCRLQNYLQTFYCRRCLSDNYYIVQTYEPIWERQSLRACMKRLMTVNEAKSGVKSSKPCNGTPIWTCDSINTLNVFGFGSYRRLKAKLILNTLNNEINDDYCVRDEIWVDTFDDVQNEGNTVWPYPKWQYHNDDGWWWMDSYLMVCTIAIRLVNMKQHSCEEFSNRPLLQWS